MKMSKAERLTLGMGKQLISTNAIIGFTLALLPCRAGEYIDAIIGFLGVTISLSVLCFIPFVVSVVITTVAYRIFK